MAFFWSKMRGATLEVVAPFLIVGLGNPGPDYVGTRHNVGFEIIDSIAQEKSSSLSFSAFKKNFKGEVSEGRFQTQKIFLLKPLTYMNLSGQSVGALLQFYKIPLDHMLVIHDDLDLPLGTVRLKKAGGNGGHNGLKSLTEHAGNDYWRLRIGIGHPGTREKVTPYVLSKFTSSEHILVCALSECIAENLSLFLANDPVLFLQKLQDRLKPYQL